MTAHQMYREHILDLYRNPTNKGTLENPTLTIKQNNPLCGDEITLQLKIKDNKIIDIKFQGVGCAISIASASLLTEKLKNMPIEKTKELTKEDILEMLKIDISPVRLKCALLPLEAIREIK